MEAKIQISEEELEPVVRRLLVKLLAEERGAEGFDDWLSYAQIVELTGLSDWTIGEAVRRGELEADYPRPRCPRVKRSKLKEWMEQRSDDEGGADIPARRTS
ncbi:MAG TPA: hypothetical protein VE713_00140 [Pyrinomonadaceae bacterium]|jgi:excisionase family DNA binding protein|nr:hypothetical protein [Pyrinomonadaceae bacterium]